MRRSTIAAVLCALAACGGSNEASPVGPAASPAPTATATPPTTVIAIDPCVVGRARVATALDPLGAIADGHGAASTHAQHAIAELTASLGDCTPTRGGAWMILPLTASLTWDGDAYALHATVHVAFVDAGGVPHHAPDEFQVGEEPAMAGTARLSIERLFDFDGDGTTEAFAYFEDHYWEDTSRRRVLLGLADGTVAPLASAHDIDISEVIDFDGDGRPDLVSIARYWSGSDCGDDPPRVGTPPVLFHSLPSGQFSANDDVAAAFLRRACPRAPTRLLGSDWPCGEQEARPRIACARVWGASAADVRARLASEEGTLSDEARELGEWAALDAFAEIDPPLVLH